MLKDFIGQEVTAVVGFSSYTLDGGANPAYYTGKVLDVNEEFIKMEVVTSNVVLGREGIVKTISGSGQCIINKKYIISVFAK